MNLHNPTPWRVLFGVSLLALFILGGATSPWRLAMAGVLCLAGLILGAYKGRLMYPEAYEAVRRFKRNLRKGRDDDVQGVRRVSGPAARRL